MGIPLHRPVLTYGLQDICRRTGQHPDCGIARTERWQRRFVTALIEGKGFPPPLPLLVGQQLSNAVHSKSQWDRAPVDAWFADRVPPDAAAREDARQRTAAAGAMDLAAERVATAMRDGWAVHAGGRA